MTKVEEQLRHYYEYREYPPDSSEYQDSLDVYLSLRSLYKQGKIDEIDIRIVDYIVCGFSYRRTAQMLGIDRRSVNNRYKKILQLLEASL